MLYLALILSGAFFICSGANEMCKTPPSVGAFASYTDSNPLTEMFVWTFTNTVQNSDVLTDVFEISQTSPAEFGQVLYDYIKASATNIGVESPHCVANTAAAAVEDYFETLVPPVIVNVFANTAAKLLQSEGLLNQMNVAPLVDSYSEILKEIAKKDVNQDDTKSKLKVLLDGFENFLISVNLLVADKGEKISSTFANEVKMAGLKLRKTSNFQSIN